MMIMRIALLFVMALLALLMLAMPAIAQQPGTPLPPPSNPSANVIDCSGLFTGSVAGTSAGLGKLTNFEGGFLGIALLLVLMTMSILGIAWAIGYGFGIEKVMSFVKSEVLESFMNLVVIAIIAVGGIGIFVPAIIFLANAAVVGGHSGVVPLSTGPNALANMYVGICNNIQANMITLSIENWLGVFVGLFINQIITSFSVAFGPNGFGVGFHPFWGYTAHQEVFWLEQTSFLAGMEFGIFIIMTLFVIYALFPLFLYLGLILRAFPWTRAAGGSFIALFIAFYIFFPALIYPFSVSASPAAGSYICGPTSSSNQSIPLCHTHSFLTIQKLSDIIAPLSTPLGAVAYQNLEDYVNGMAYVGLQLIGFVIALIISYDLVEQLAGILGAPSVQARRIFSRVV